jgi:hypothetical protein
MDCSRGRGGYGDRDDLPDEIEPRADPWVEMIRWLRARRMYVSAPVRGPVVFRRKRWDQP